MRITGRNSAVTGLEDVIAQSGTLTVPTQARIHRVSSASVQDDASGLQVETAVIVGTITLGGNATVTLTSGLTVGSPLALTVPLALNDTPTQSAAKIAAFLNLTAAVALDYVASSSGANLILTAKVVAANDATLNIAYTNDTCTGLTPDASSNNTHSGSTKTGALTLRIEGVKADGKIANEIVSMYGTDYAYTVNEYLYINDARVNTAGSTGSNVGAITLAAVTDATTTMVIPATENKGQQAIFISDGVLNRTITRFSASTYNATAGAVTTLSFWSKAYGGVWIKEQQIELSESFPDFDDNDSGFFQKVGPKSFFKVMAQASAGTSLVNVNFDVN